MRIRCHDSYELGQIGIGTTTYSYDPAGNRTLAQEPTSTVTTYSYDVDYNLSIAMNNLATPTATMVYHADGLWHSDDQSDYAWDRKVMAVNVNVATGQTSFTYNQHPGGYGWMISRLYPILASSSSSSSSSSHPVSSSSTPGPSSSSSSSSSSSGLSEAAIRAITAGMKAEAPGAVAPRVLLAPPPTRPITQ